MYFLLLYACICMCGGVVGGRGDADNIELINETLGDLIPECFCRTTLKKQLMFFLRWRWLVVSGNSSLSSVFFTFVILFWFFRLPNDDNGDGAVWDDDDKEL